MNNQSIDLLAGNVLMASRAIPDLAWTVSSDGGAILGKTGCLIAVSALNDEAEGDLMLQNLCFIRNAAPILATRAARAVRIAQELVEALEAVKHTSALPDALEVATKAIYRAEALGIKTRGRENGQS